MVFGPKSPFLLGQKVYRSFYKLILLITKVRHNLAHLELQEKALIYIPRLLLPHLSYLHSAPSPIAPIAPSPTAHSFIPHMLLIFISPILLQSLSSFSAFSNSSQFHHAPPPMMLRFIKRLLLPHLSSFRAFSYGEQRNEEGAGRKCNFEKILRKKKDNL